jgi:hypothetical protein
MHQPEHWGYVQFSTRPPGRDTFRPDPTRPAREALRQIYHAQRAYHAKHGRWATTLPDLGLDPTDLSRDLPAPPTLETTPDGYRARATARGPEGANLNLSMEQDSRIRTE